MDMKAEILEIVISAAKEMGIESNSQALQKANSSTKLYGQNGNLDSLNLVRFIGEVEELIADKLEKDITIASEKAMSRRSSPFNSIKSLSDYVNEIIKSDEDA